jgi:hypothetical protein
MTIKLTPAQHATVLAALHYYELEGMAADRPKRLGAVNSVIFDIATKAGSIVALNAHEIDHLCDSIRLADDVPPRG